ncbi:MAG: DUF2194 domain-containing protein [Anaerolineales bacterium]|nr:DUF2194 domain-containing protein [Anaerolineales bacterium]
MKKDYSFSYVLIPLVFLLVLAGGLLFQRAGIQYDTAEKPGDLQLLPQASVNVANYFPNKPVEVLVLLDPQEADTKNLNENLKATLDSMRVKYVRFSITSGQAPVLTNYQTVIIATSNLSVLESQLSSILDWVGNGGRLLFAIRPLPSSAFNSISAAVGIISGPGNDNLIQASGVEYKTDFMVGGKGLILESEDLEHTSFPVQLSKDAVVHMVSADVSKTPLLWQYNYEKGRIVFINTDRFGSKEGRGVSSAAYSLLYDVFAYPVINTSVFFLDDFPSPVPAGTNDLITSQYGMDIDHFYTNVWWPELQALAKKYNYKYTGVVIETYDDNVIPPFTKQLDTDRHQYFGRLLLVNDGEVGLHGYNHIPFCLAETGVNKLFDYPDWPTTEAMQLSAYELFGFTKEILPGNKFETYVPVSNILCSDARLWLPAVLPNIKVIASVYINDPQKLHYEQEFTEASDGIIELPRIISGYIPDNFVKWTVINELTLHFVNSHFAHPDDVLSKDRGNQQTWDLLRDQFEDYLKWLYSSAPGLRSMTAKQGAVAVQRFARLAVDAQMVNGAYEINLGNFYDEASLMLRTTRKPISIEGGKISEISSDLYLILASKSKIVVTFEGETP